MGDIVNLRAARKKVERRAAERAAAEQRHRYGRSKAKRRLETTRNIKMDRDLDGHRIEMGDGG
jgi:hypothetical protein